jgi:hypothetical protein
VSIERRGAVRADDPQVLKPMVVVHAIDVVKDHAHHLAPPNLALAAELANRLLQASLIQALFEVLARERAILDQDLFKWFPLTTAPAANGRIGIEVIGSDAPELRVLPQNQMPSARLAHP